jgi:sec-independent protein translocase protein TatB
MFDLDFSKLILIGVVALIVIGPERLPRVARTAGHLLGRFQRYVAEVKSDISREMELAELKTLQTSVEDAARSIEHSVKTGMEDAQKEFRDVQTTLEDTGAELRKTEDALKQAVSGMQLPHMGTAVATGQDQLAESGSAAPTTADVPSQLVSATESSGIVSGTVSTQPLSLAAQDAQRVEGDDASPQMELPLDPARELLTRKQA